MPKSSMERWNRLSRSRVRFSSGAPPLVAECFARLVETRCVNQYNLFVLEVFQAWVDPKPKKPKTIHHQGCGKFAVDGETIKIRSRMR